MTNWTHDVVQSIDFLSAAADSPQREGDRLML